MRKKIKQDRSVAFESNYYKFADRNRRDVEEGRTFLSDFERRVALVCSLYLRLRICGDDSVLFLFLFRIL